MISFEDIKIAYKKDDFGSEVTSRVCWSSSNSEFVENRRPIVIVTHAGGLVVGSADIVPKPQIDYLTRKGAVVVIPNYRLAPQVDAVSGSFADIDDAFTWTTTILPTVLDAQHSVKVDPERLATVGHSVGGTMALYLAAQQASHVKAVAALYPSLYMSDKSSTSYQPYTKPPFGVVPDFEPTEDDWATIAPKGRQIAEAALVRPGTLPPPRNKWQLTLIKKGKLMDAIQPDGRLAKVDPCLRFKAVGKAWPPTVFVNPDQDDIPGSGPVYIGKAAEELRSAGAAEVKVIDVPDAVHMFDLPPTVGTTDLDHKWGAVVEALDFVLDHLR